MNAAKTSVQTQAAPGKDKPVVPVSSRMYTGRAMNLDVWSIYNAANLPNDCINLGQGYMNFAPPEWAKEGARRALDDITANHYSHPKGRIRLREAVRDHYGPSFHRELNPDTEILITSGANEGQYAMWTAFLEPGDEVILFEPWFDQYLPSITFNHGVPVFVPLTPPPHSDRPLTSAEWRFDINQLRAAFTPKTKMIVVNTPHNPVGKVFTREELVQIGELAKEFNVLVMSDEVYDCLHYDDTEHVRIATLPGMWERTVTVGSGGKSFAATGWRVGWLIGPYSLIGPTLAATTRIVFCSNSPMQEAVATSLEKVKHNDFFETQRLEYQERRDILVDCFKKLGMQYTFPEGSYFLLVDISNLDMPDDYTFPDTIHGRGRDFKACWFMAHEVGVSSIPVSEFYGDDHRHLGERWARFAFCKDTDLLRRATERLQGLKKFLKN